VADQEGPADRHRHQGVDVQPPLPQRRQPLGVHRQPGQGDGGQRQCDLQSLMQPGSRQQRVDALSRRRQHQGGDQAIPSHAVAHLTSGGSWLHNVRRVTEPAQDRFGLGESRRFGADHQRAGSQLEPQLSDPCHAS
jgi:hypothetical protein